MSNGNGCKIALLVVIVALFAGAVGFASGFASHAVLVAAESVEAPLALIEATPVIQSTEADQRVDPGIETTPPPSQSTPEPIPVPTMAIPPATGEEFDLFWEAWDLIQQDYYGDLPTAEEMTYGAIRGATNVLGDPYTAFVEPAAAEHRRETEGGSYEGIGALVSMEDGWLTIVEPFEDQPAEKAGLRPGDLVLQVDETPIENMSVYEAIALILGPAGTEVRLKILREGAEPFEVVVTRAHIEVPMVEWEVREDGIAYVSLFNFDSDSHIKLAQAIEELLAQNPKGLIFDLRGNPGGFLHEAVLTAGLFVPKDTVVMIERTKEDEIRLRPEDFGAEDPIAPDIPLVVLVNGGSASASEIVAGALQDLDRSVLIGEQTFGKGSVQLLHELSNGAELRVTTARWFTPNDRAIHGEGLMPDFELEMTQEDMEADLDPQLERAVEYLLTGQ
jgi:carboxyl-terminal processing protease